jgi:phosphoglycolate phosphatase-like HAD superfamily hydrolase
MKFILFDIDGTLIDSGGAGTKSLSLAFMEMFSVKDAFRTISMAGKTDLQIIREGLELYNIDHTNGIIPEFCRKYLKHLRIQMMNGKGYIKSGIKEALEALKPDEEIVLGLLTGNVKEGARIKLEYFGLHSYFGIGAFGDDDEDRNKLLPIALDKLYRQNSSRISFRDCIVIGDTPRDITCSKPYGALSIAVSTGPYSFKALSDAGADVVLEDLSDTEGFMSIIRNT